MAFRVNNCDVAGALPGRFTYDVTLNLPKNLVRNRGPESSSDRPEDTQQWSLVFGP